MKDKNYDLKHIHLNLYVYFKESVTARASAAAAALAFDTFTFLQFVFRYSADAASAELSIGLLDTLEAAEVLEAGLSPFCNQLTVDELFSKQILIQLARDDFLLIVKVVDVAAALMVQAQYRLENLCFPLALRIRIGGCFQFQCKLL